MPDNEDESYRNYSVSGKDYTHDNYNDINEEVNGDEEDDEEMKSV